MSCVWFSPDKALCIQAKVFNLSHQTTIICLMISVCHMPSCKLQACCHVPFSQEWLPSAHSPINPRLVKCCRDLSFWQVLPSQPRNSGVFIAFLVTSLTKALLARLRSLVGQQALGRVWVVPHFFNFPTMETTELWETFNPLDIVLYPSPAICLITILSQI